LRAVNDDGARALVPARAGLTEKICAETSLEIDSRLGMLDAGGRMDDMLNDKTLSNSGHATRTTVRFLALIFTALCLMPAGAHFFELPHKISLDESDYFTVQTIYQGWAYFGIALIGAILTNFALVLASRRQHASFWFAVAGFVLIAATLVIFFTWTYPANQATHNWTVMVSNWRALREQWEYAHAISAIVTFFGFCAVALSALTAKR